MRKGTAMPNDLTTEQLDALHWAYADQQPGTPLLDAWTHFDATLNGLSEPRAEEIATAMQRVVGIALVAYQTKELERARHKYNCLQGKYNAEVKGRRSAQR